MRSGLHPNPHYPPDSFEPDQGHYVSTIPVNQSRFAASEDSRELHLQEPGTGDALSVASLTSLRLHNNN